jgi:O-antigen ligase
MLTVLTLFLSTGALLGLLLAGPVSSNALGRAAPVGSSLTEILWTGLYTLFIVLAFVRRQRLLASLLRERNLCLLVSLAILSTLWSDSPSLTLWNSGRLIATTFFGVYVAKTYSLEDIFRMVAWATALSAVLSIVCVFALPQYGVDTYLQRTVWRGVFDHKNTLGSIMALGALTWLIFSLGAGRPRWLGVLLFGICSLLVVLSGSATSLVVECALLFAIVLFAKVHRSVIILAGLCLMVLVALFVVEVQHPIEVVLGLLNREEDLTGRAQVWALVLEAISKHPWMGYGYMAFWRGADGPSADINLAGWIPSSAHNGFLNLELEFGVVGPVLFAFALTGPIRYAIRAAQRRKSAVELFPLVFLLYIVLSNLTEGTNLNPNSVIWLVFVVLCIKRSITQSQARNVFRRRGMEIRSSAWDPLAGYSYYEISSARNPGATNLLSQSVQP